MCAAIAEMVQVDAVNVGWGLGSIDGRRVGIYPVVTLGHSWRLSFMHGYGCAEAAISAESCVPGKALETCADIWLSSTERKKSGAEQALACSTCRLAKNPTHGPRCRVKKKCQASTPRPS